MNRTSITIAVLALAACGAEAPAPEATQAEDEQAKPEHFLSEHQRAMDRTKALQGELNASVEKRLEEVDRQSRDDPDEDDR